MKQEFEQPKFNGWVYPSKDHCCTSSGRDFWNYPVNMAHCMRYRVEFSIFTIKKNVFGRDEEDTMNTITFYMSNGNVYKWGFKNAGEAHRQFEEIKAITLG